MLNTIEMHDRMVPHHILDYYQAAQDEINRRVFQRCHKYSKCDEIEEFSLEFPQEFPGQQYMGADPITRRFQQLMLQAIGAKNVLEIGTFVGASTMSMARCVGQDGHVYSIEKYQRFAQIAKRNFEKNKVENITLLQGDAFEILQTPCGGGVMLPSSFDFIFLDGNKERYADYFEALWEYLAVGGILMIDDGLFQGDILNDSPSTQKGQGVLRFLESVRVKKRAFPVLLPLGVGLCFVLKQNKTTRERV